jgi:hypothetical protein
MAPVSVKLAIVAFLADFVKAARVKPHAVIAKKKTFMECPYKYRYDTEQDKMIGGSMSFECHKMSTGEGNSCPELQQARLKTVKKFGEANYNEYLNLAKTFPLKPLFDKTEKVSGSESYEQMLHMHVEGLMHRDVKFVEDKIMLKQLATKLEIPATKMYFGAHRDDWDIKKFKRMLGDLCLKGVDEFIIKAVHLAWSAGQKIVRGWQKDCEYEGSTNKVVDELAVFVDKEIMSVLASEADAHLREFVTPGVTVEELFKTGGHSKRPLEAKVQVVWGKVHHMFFVGDGPRGCKSYPGAWSILGDGTGWDLNGMIGTPGGNDEISDAFLAHAFDGVVQHSESFAKEVGADVMRVDFFIGFNEDGSVTYKLNEAESVSGARYWHEREQIGRAWVDGYILSDRMRMTPEKWDRFTELAEKSRAANHLD